MSKLTQSRNKREGWYAGKLAGGRHFRVRHRWGMLFTTWLNIVEIICTK